MPHRRLVRIGETPALPTIAQFLTEMATRQHEEIERLKREAQQGRLPDPTVPQEHHEELTPDPWQLHPVRITKAAGRKGKKSGKKSVKKTGAKLRKKAAKRAKAPSQKRRPAARKRRSSAGKRR